MHLFDFLSCILRCFFKLLAWDDAWLHLLPVFDFFPLIVSLNWTIEVLFWRCWSIYNWHVTSVVPMAMVVSNWEQFIPASGSWFDTHLTSIESKRYCRNRTMLLVNHLIVKNHAGGLFKIVNENQPKWQLLVLFKKVSHHSGKVAVWLI